MRVLLAGGGTAGHTSPLLATADALRRLDPSIEITCLGTPRGLETRVVPEAGYPLELIPPVPLPRRPNADFFKVPARLRRAVKETYAVFDRVRPDVVVGYGGYVSMPAYLAARRRKLPLVVHEGNALPGLANKAGARFATRVAVSFPDTDLRHAEYVGLPIRRMISQLDRAASATRLVRSSACDRTCRHWSSRVGRRARAGSTRRCPPPRECSEPRASRCCTSSGRRARPSRRPPTCPTSSSTSSTGWTWPWPRPT